FHPAAITKEPPVCREFDFARFLIFGVVEDNPVSNTAVVARVKRRNAALRPNSVTDFHHLRSERAGYVNVCLVVMTFDEGDACRITLYAMPRATAKPVTSVTRLRRYTPKVSFFFHVAFITVRPHPRAVHDRAFVDTLGV